MSALQGFLLGGGSMLGVAIILAAAWILHQLNQRLVAKDTEIAVLKDRVQALRDDVLQLEAARGKAWTHNQLLELENIASAIGAIERNHEITADCIANAKARIGKVLNGGPNGNGKYSRKE